MKLALLILLAFFVAVHLAGCLMGRREALSAPDDGAPPCPPPDKKRARPPGVTGRPISKTKRAHARPFGRAFFYGFGRRRKTPGLSGFFVGFSPPQAHIYGCVPGLFRV